MKISYIFHLMEKKSVNNKGEGKQSSSLPLLFINQQLRHYFYIQAKL